MVVGTAIIPSLALFQQCHVYYVGKKIARCEKLLLSTTGNNGSFSPKSLSLIYPYLFVKNVLLSGRFVWMPGLFAEAIVFVFATLDSPECQLSRRAGLVFDVITLSWLAAEAKLWANPISLNKLVPSLTTPSPLSIFISSSKTERALHSFLRKQIKDFSSTLL